MSFSFTKISHTVIGLVFLSALPLLATVPALAKTKEVVLHSFTCQETDGCVPEGGVVLDSKGNLYGTTAFGGANSGGVVFVLAPTGEFTILYSFNPQSGDGYMPQAGVVRDSQGNLWGTTSQGGAHRFGTVFEVTASGTEPWFYSFTSGGSLAGVVLDKQGNLYGATETGGSDGCGQVFKLVPSTSTLTALYSFICNSTDGMYPSSGVVFDSQGNLYGTTRQGGAYGLGTVFKVTPSGEETILHSFTFKGRDGFYPYGDVTLDSSGNVYGTTTYGGTIGVGTVFEVTPSGTESVLHSFRGGADGIYISSVGTWNGSGMLMDGNGNLYGTTGSGGASDLGTVFKLTSSGTQKVLYSFTDNGKDGWSPNTSLATDNSGSFYGTTTRGGTNQDGTVFKVTP
jgi:uncharacterized repeat protein (TIGR03803 family)